MSDLKKINHRLITCFQSSGRIGKSTAFEGILAWAKFAGVAVAAVDYAACFLQRSSTFLIAVAIKDAIKSAVPNPKQCADSNIRSAYQVSRLIRNAFTHAPFHPIWSIDPNCRDQKFEVQDIIELDTHELDGQPFDWRHYGGPLAILRLSQFVRTAILHDSQVHCSAPSDPKQIYTQQGGLILKKIDRLPADVVPL